MKILDTMRSANFKPGLLGLAVSRRNTGWPRQSRHHSGGQPPRQVAGVHGGSPALLLELLGHARDPDSASGDQIHHHAGDDVSTGAVRQPLMFAESMPHLEGSYSVHRFATVAGEVSHFR